MIDKVLLLLLFGAVIFAIAMKSAIDSQKRIIAELEAKIDAQKKNTVYLFKHAQEISAIKSKEKQTAIDIEEAKSDEEIYDIIDSIISANNKRVYNINEYR